MAITLEQFAAGTGATTDNAQTYYDQALQVMERYAIDQADERIAAFLATLGIESAHLTKMEEDLYYKDPTRLAQLFKRAFDENHDGAVSAQEIEDAKPFCRNPKALSQELYGGFHGRGGIQLTWEANYRTHSDRLGTDYVSNPSLLVTPDHCILIAGDFWDLHQCNDVAGDMGTVTLRVNGPRRLALAERIALMKEGLQALA